MAYDDDDAASESESAWERKDAFTCEFDDAGRNFRERILHRDMHSADRWRFTIGELVRFGARLRSL